MRICPSCGTRFSNDGTFCPHDGQPLEDLPDEVEVVDPLLGQTIDGRYLIERSIGEGGMGIVYQATHTSLGRKLALKVLRGEMAKDPDVVKRFVQEAQACSSIGHANIIDITDFGNLPDGTAYFVMEFLVGEPLTDLIRRGGSLAADEAVALVRQIASALSAAHARGIVHRDLKPDNIFLIESGGIDRFVKVLDFGIAKVGGANSKLTKTGMIFGTPHYMSPEQSAGQMVDARTDVYALGVIMYEMFTGQVPFDADTFMGILSKHMFEQPAPPSELNGSLGALEPMILKALMKTPEDRYPSMQALLDDLDTVESGGRVTIGASRPAAISTPAGYTHTPKPAMHTERVELPKSKAPFVAGAVVLAVLLVAGLGAALGSTDAGSTDPEQAPTGIVAAPGPEPTPEPEPAPEPEEIQVVVLVRIESEPLGATVFASGAIVGNTPLSVPRPTGTTTQRLDIRHPGFVEAAVEVNAASEESILVPLEAEPEARRRRPRPVPVPVPVVGEPPAPTPPATMRRRRAPPPAIMNSEVVDPWAT